MSRFAPFEHIPLAAMAATLGWVGCAPSTAELTVGAIEPASGWNGESVDVLVEGTGFYPGVTATAADGGAQVEHDFVLQLLDRGEPVATLTEPALLSVDQLTAQVPPGIEPGRYDLQVTSPRGSSATLSGAFTVKGTRAQRLTLDPVDPALFWIVEQTATFDVGVRDGDNVRLLEPLPVRVSVASAGGESIVAGFPDDVLLDQVTERRSSGASIVGRLRLDGTARIPVSVATPSTVLLTVDALEPDIESATTQLNWYEQADYLITVELPRARFTHVAGESFSASVAVRDAQGSVVDDPVYPIYAQLTDACGEVAVDLQDIRGTTQVPVTLNHATGPHGCAPQQRLMVQHGSATTESPQFPVEAAEISRFQVDMPAAEVAAGTQVLAQVIPVDLFGNRTRYDGDPSTLVVRDSSGDIDRVGCVHNRGVIDCAVEPILAERGVVLLVRDPELGLIGTSLPYSVRSGPVSDIQVVARPGSDGTRTAVAGAPVEVDIFLFDRFGNPDDKPPFDESAFTITERDGAPALCSLMSATVGSVRFDCRILRAGPSLVLTVFGPEGSAASAEPFSVVNGPLDRIDIELPADPVVAGEAFTLALHAFDAYDNAYLEQDDPVVLLSESAGTLSPGSVALDPLGRASLPVTVTRAGNTIVEARQSFLLGISDPLTVRPGPANHLDVELATPWLWRDESGHLTVTARDRYDNRAGLSESVDLWSAADAFASAQADLVDGQLALTIVPDRADLSDEIHALSDSGLEGSLSGIFIAQSCGADGPTAALTFDGSTHAVACLTDGEALVDTHLKGTAAGGAAIDRYRIWAPDGHRAPATADHAALRFNRVGRFDIVAMVASGTCAHQVGAAAWVNTDDGGPTGPIPLSLSSSVLRVEQDTAAIDIGVVRDCAGDAVDKRKVKLRTDRGELDDTTSSGSGLYITTTTTGRGKANLDLTSTSGAGAGRIFAWTSEGAAGGSVGFLATQDKIRPTVDSQDPEGFTSSTVHEILVRFSEPIHPDSYDIDDFTVTGPTAAFVDRIELRGPRTLAVVLSAPIVGSAGRWTLEISSDLRDLSDQALDGERVGAASVYQGDFGAVASDVAAGATCTVSRTTFRPDGDDGFGSESDELKVSFETRTAPAVWRVSVSDPDGRVVRHERIDAADSNSGSFDFDGRDASERILDNGVYDVTITPANEAGTLGASCAVELTLDNRGAQ